MKRTLHVAGIALALCTTLLSADDKKMDKPAMMTPVPDAMLTSLSWMNGTWQCKGTAFASDFGPEHATQSRVTVQSELGGMWMGFHVAEDKTKVNPMPYAGAGHWGYEAEKKMIVSGWVDNMGGYATQASAGYVGDMMEFTGPMHANGMTMNSRDTFMKKSDRELVHAYYVDNNGTWVKLGEETCKKK